MYARPEPLGLSDILAALGVPQNTDTTNTLAALIPAVTSAAASTTSTTATTTVPSNIFESFYSGLTQGIAKVFSFLPLPKATSNNPIFTILSAFLASLQQTASVTNNPTANSVVDLVSQVVANMDTTTQDPLASVITTATNTANSLIQSAIEVVPTFVTSILFGSSSQSRDIYSFSLDVAAGISGFVAGIQNWIASTFNLGASTVAYLFSGLNLAVDSFPKIVQNVTSIGTTNGLPGGAVDILMQVVAAAELIVSEANNVVSTVADTIISSTDGTVEGAVNAVLGYINPAVASVVSTVAPNCAAPFTNTLTTLALDVENAVETCARSEAGTWTNILDQTSAALESTNVLLAGMKGVFDSLLRFDVWGFFNNVSVFSRNSFNVSFYNFVRSRRLGASWEPCPLLPPTMP